MNPEDGPDKFNMYVYSEDTRKLSPRGLSYSVGVSVRELCACGCMCVSARNASHESKVSRGRNSPTLTTATVININNIISNISVCGSMPQPRRPRKPRGLRRKRIVPGRDGRSTTACWQPRCSSALVFVQAEFKHDLLKLANNLQLPSCVSTIHKSPLPLPTPVHPHTAPTLAKNSRVNYLRAQVRKCWTTR